MKMEEGDTVIAFSFPRYSSRIINAVDFAKLSGARVIAITDSLQAPIAKNAYATLCAKSDMASFADSLVAPLSIVNAILAAIGMKRQEMVSDTLAHLEAVWDEYNVYEKRGAGKEDTK